MVFLIFDLPGANSFKLLIQTMHLHLAIQVRNFCRHIVSGNITIPCTAMALSTPNGVMEFVVSDTANNDTNNYWLAYDISSTAVNNNVLDARFDSTEVFGSFRLPINGNPTGNRQLQHQ
jgi:hypothetical protein